MGQRVYTVTLYNDNILYYTFINKPFFKIDSKNTILYTVCLETADINSTLNLSQERRGDKQRTKYRCKSDGFSNRTGFFFFLLVYNSYSLIFFVHFIHVVEPKPNGLFACRHGQW